MQGSPDGLFSCVQRARYILEKAEPPKSFTSAVVKYMTEKTSRMIWRGKATVQSFRNGAQLHPQTSLSSVKLWEDSCWITASVVGGGGGVKYKGFKSFFCGFEDNTPPACLTARQLNPLTKFFLEDIISFPFKSHLPLNDPHLAQTNFPSVVSVFCLLLSK